MNLIEFILAPDNTPFAVAIGLVIAIGLLEGIGMVLGFAISGLLDNLVPDVDLDIDGPDIDSHGAFGEFLSWLRFREVPVIVILIAFLTAFGLIGYTIQALIVEYLGKYPFNAWFIGPIAFVVCLPFVRLFAGLLSKIMPKDETSAVKSGSFVGHSATVVLGSMARGEAAQIKIKDKHGQTHYLMAEPDSDGATFSQGNEVLIVRKDDKQFYVIANTNEYMTDETTG
jgi:hypothetical protein